MTQSTAAIEVAGLTFRYPGAQQDTLRGVDLRIEEGDFVAVVGGNGSGKTTLCKSFNGIVPHFWDGDLAGSVRVCGRDTLDESVATLSTLVGYVYQDFGNQLVRPTVRDDVAFAPVNFGLADWQERTDRALDALGITGLADRYTWQLSGGQQHLTAVAGALALAPRILVVDEPVAEVDPARAHEIYARLERLNREHGTTIIVIEHHAEFVARYARSVVLMDHGTVRWHLPVRDALARTDDLEAADIPAPQVTAVVRAFEASGAVPLTVDEAVTWVRERAPYASASATGHVPGFASATGHVPGPSAAQGHPPVIARLDRVTHSYRTVTGPRHTVLDDLSLELHEGERVALVGGNGAGKSTLLSLLSGLIVAREGTVEVDGVDTRTEHAGALADRVALLGQRPEEAFLTDSIRGDVAMHPAGRGVPDVDAMVDDVLERFALADLADRDGRLLSGGQQRRATLAMGLAMRPRLLLLDEPTSSLDLRTRDDVIALLAALAEHIRCVVVATHDMHLVAEWADRVVVLDAGRVIADVTPHELFADADLLERARLVPPQVTQVGAALGLDPVPLTVDALVEWLRAVGVASDQSLQPVEVAS